MFEVWLKMLPLELHSEVFLQNLCEVVSTKRVISAWAQHTIHAILNLQHCGIMGCATQPVHQHLAETSHSMGNIANLVMVIKLTGKGYPLARPAAALSLQNPMWREATVSNDLGRQP